RRKTIAGASSQQNDLLIPLRDLIPDELEWDALATRLVAEVEAKTVPDLLQALSAKPGFDDLRTEDASIWLKRQAQLDFEADRMVVVKGWYLAEIEGLLLALVWHLQ